MKRSRPLAGIAVLASACFAGNYSLEGRACDPGDDCGPDLVCDSEQGRCLPEVQPGSTSGPETSQGSEGSTGSSAVTTSTGTATSSGTAQTSLSEDDSTGDVPAPDIETLDPPAIHTSQTGPGSVVTIRGSGFDEDASIEIAGDPVVPTSVTADAIEVAIPSIADPGSVPVMVTNLDGESASASLLVSGDTAFGAAQTVLELQFATGEPTLGADVDIKAGTFGGSSGLAILVQDGVCLPSPANCNSSTLLWAPVGSLRARSELDVQVLSTRAQASLVFHDIVAGSNDDEIVTVDSQLSGNTIRLHTYHSPTNEEVVQVAPFGGVMRSLQPILWDDPNDASPAPVLALAGEYNESVYVWGPWPLPGFDAVAGIGSENLGFLDTSVRTSSAAASLCSGDGEYLYARLDGVIATASPNPSCDGIVYPAGDTFPAPIVGFWVDATAPDFAVYASYAVDGEETLWRATNPANVETRDTVVLAEFSAFSDLNLDGTQDVLLAGRESVNSDGATVISDVHGTWPGSAEVPVWTSAPHIVGTAVVDANGDTLPDAFVLSLDSSTAGAHTIQVHYLPNTAATP